MSAMIVGQESLNWIFATLMGQGTTTSGQSANFVGQTVSQNSREIRFLNAPSPLWIVCGLSNEFRDDL